MDAHRLEGVGRKTASIVLGAALGYRQSPSTGMWSVSPKVSGSTAPDRHRGEPSSDLPEKDWIKDDVVRRSPWSTHLPADSALPDLSNHRPLPVSEEDEDVARGAAIQPARAPSASTIASPTMTATVSPKPSPDGSNGAGARPIASTIT